MSYPPFNWSANQACVKCGNRETHDVDYIGARRMTGGPSFEYLERTCRRCNYKWPEGCLDDVN